VRFPLRCRRAAAPREEPRHGRLGPGVALFDLLI
jgi:hypothetical protein